MAIAIPREYGARIAAGDSVDVQILIDGSDSNTASIAKGYAETAVLQHSQQLRADRQNRGAGMRQVPPVDYRQRVLYNSSMQSKNYIVPGLIAVILMIIAALLTSLTIAREWEMGTMEQLLSTPLRPAEMVLGKMLAFFVLGAVDTIVAVVVGVAIFDVPLRGSLAFLALSSCVFLFGALFWGILISSIAKNQLLAFQMGILSSFLPAFLFVGLYLCRREHAGSDPVDHVRDRPALLRDDFERRFFEGCWHRSIVASTAVSVGLRDCCLRGRNQKAARKAGVIHVATYHRDLSQRDPNGSPRTEDASHAVCPADVAAHHFWICCKPGRRYSQRWHGRIRTAQPLAASCWPDFKGPAGFM